MKYKRLTNKIEKRRGEEHERGREGRERDVYLTFKPDQQKEMSESRYDDAKQ